MLFLKLERLSSEFHNDTEDSTCKGNNYTERKKKRRVEFFPSYFNHFLRCLL